MPEIPFLRDLAIMVVAGMVFVLIGRRLRAPTIIAYIAAGLILGPVTGLLEPTASIELIAETGIVLLLFLVGLELSLEKIRDIGPVAMVAGVGQVGFTAAGGFLLAWLMGFDPVPALLIATALTFSSTVVVVKVLSQKGDIDRLYGRIAVGIFLVQDLIVIVALTLLTGLGSGTGLTVGSIAAGIGSAVGGMMVLLGLALLSARYLLPRLFAWMSPSAEGTLIWSLAWCFLFAAGAELLHLSIEIGGFLAGISLAQLRSNHDLRRRVRPLMNFFVMVFFISLGVHMELGAAREHAMAAAVLSLFVLVGNPLIFLVIIGRMGYGTRTAFLTSVTVAQISEFSFVFAALGLSSGLIDESVLSLIGIVGLVTIAASVYMILYNEELYNFLSRSALLRWLAGSGEAERSEAPEPAPLEGHVVVVGMNAMGRRIVDKLLEQGEVVVAVDTDPRKLEPLPCLTVLGNVDHSSVLDEARFRRARLLVSALQIEETNALLAFRGRSAGVPTSIHAFDQFVLAELEGIGATHLLDSKYAGIRRLIETIRGMGLIRG
ncbi:MAG: cation:proton antiporter [Gemmatimonadales bacterium]